MDKSLRVNDFESLYMSYFGARPCPPDAVTLLKHHVSKCVLLRVPKEAFGNFRTLLDTLQLRASPFRFLDLPAELRNRVYDLLLGDNKVDYPLYFGFEHSHWRTPPISRVSKQLRAEFLPMNYQCSNLHFIVCHQIARTKSPAATAILVKSWRSWTKRQAAQYLKDLRRVTIRWSVLHYPDQPCEVRFYYSPNKGLTIEYLSTYYTKASMPTRAAPQPGSWPYDGYIKQVAAWKAHAEAVESERKEQGLAGEAISMAVISRPEIWE